MWVDVVLELGHFLEETFKFRGLLCMSRLDIDGMVNMPEVLFGQSFVQRCEHLVPDIQIRSGDSIKYYIPESEKGGLIIRQTEPLINCRIQLFHRAIKALSGSLSDDGLDSSNEILKLFSSWCDVPYGLQLKVKRYGNSVWVYSENYTKVKKPNSEIAFNFEHMKDSAGYTKLHPRAQGLFAPTITSMPDEYVYNDVLVHYVYDFRGLQSFMTDEIVVQSLLGVFNSSVKNNVSATLHKSGIFRGSARDFSPFIKGIDVVKSSDNTVSLKLIAREDGSYKETRSIAEYHKFLKANFINRIPLTFYAKLEPALQSYIITIGV
jgi:hypothetical protein